MGQLRFYNTAMAAMSGLSASIGGGGGGSEADFSWTYSGAGTTKTYYFTVTNGVDYTIDWGDTTQSNLTGTGASQGTSHTYGSGTFTGKITIATPDDFLGCSLFAVKISGDLPDPSQYTKMTTYKIEVNSGLNGLIPDFTSNTLLTDLRIESNALNDTLGSLDGLTELTTLYCYNMANVTGAIPNFSTNTKLTKAYCYSCGFSSYAGTTVPASLVNAWFYGNAITSSDEIDRILAAFDTAGASNGTLKLESGTNAIPSAAGLASKTSLEGKGWTVTVNS